MARMARRTLLGRENPPTFIAVIAEDVIRHPTGGADVMREQTHALLTASRRAHVTVRLLPADTGAHAGLEGAFVSLSFGDDDPDISYTENIAGETYVENAEDNARIRLAFSRLIDAALSEQDSAARIVELSES